MRVDRQLISGMSPNLQQVLQKRVDREFGHVPIVKEHVWAEPTWAFLGFVGDQLVSFLNIVDREVLADDTPTHFFGLNNVITEPEHRGCGYSTQLNQKAQEFMAETDPAGCGFLFCADDLVPFYTKLGWHKFDGEVIVSQPSGDKPWPSNAMFYDLSGGRRTWKRIHLCGLPW
jgi:hypothetical protein